MRTDDFDYDLPPELIAQTPAEPRDSARLLLLDRRTGSLAHHQFSDLPALLTPGDLLVANDTRVLPARLVGWRAVTGGKVELLLLRRIAKGEWEALARPARRLRPGERLYFAPARPRTAGPEDAIEADRVAPVLEAVIIGVGDAGTRIVRFTDEDALARVGQTPLPPYIRTPIADPERYQTVYSRVAGSAAAPTAGLHFTPALLARLQAVGIGFATVTLHVGLDTFRPVDVADPRDHRLHREYVVVPAATVEAIRRTKAAGHRVIAVGTTTVRALETAARAGEGGGLCPYEGWTDLYILPGFDFQVVDALITNFHLPRSTLLMLVAAFAGKAMIDRAYREAIAQRYRFYSFGDAMFIV